MQRKRSKTLLCVSTRVHFKVRSRFCEYEVKKLRSLACSRQENAVFSPYIHRTWEAYFSPSLYVCYDIHSRLRDGEETTILPLPRSRNFSSNDPGIMHDVSTTLFWSMHSLQGLAKMWSPGCVNAAGKARQTWKATAATEFTKPPFSQLCTDRA